MSMLIYSNVRDSSDKNQNPKDEWRRFVPPLIFNVLSKTYIAIEATEIIPIPESVATLLGIKNQTQ